jgi:hypothetical protein
MEIYKKISLIMKEIEAIKKDKTNAIQKFKFRGIDDVYKALNPLLKEHGVFSVPTVLEQVREERQSHGGGALKYSILKIKYTFYAEDGSSIECVVIGEGMDSGDKASNKAMSIAHKYAYLQIFSIPTEDAIDPDSESHEVAQIEKKINFNLTPKGRAITSLSDSELIAFNAACIKQYSGTEKEPYITQTSELLKLRGYETVNGAWIKKELLTDELVDTETRDVTDKEVMDVDANEDPFADDGEFKF